MQRPSPVHSRPCSRFLRFLLVLVTLLAALPCQGKEPLRMGVLQIEDVVPFYLADQEGFFQEQGVEVKLVPFLSALERDSALTAEAIDGAINDPIGAILFDRGRSVLRITSLGLGQSPAEGPFAILAAPNSPFEKVEELKGVEIAVSRATIIEYVTDRLLRNRGFSPEEIRTIDVKKMPIRMQMLLAGSVQAATLPEPLASIAVGSGARVLASDAQAEESLSQTVIVFRSEVLTQRRADVAAFFRGYRRGVEALNDHPETYRDLFVRIGRIPAGLATHYPIPRYPLPAPFPRELYQPVIDWLCERQLTPPLAYESMVAVDFLDPR